MREFIIGNGVLFRIKIIIDVGMEKAKCIPYPPVGLDEPADDVFGDFYIVTIILIGGPEPQNLSADFSMISSGSNDIAQSTWTLSSRAVNDKAMGQYRDIRGLAFVPHGSEKGTVKPASVLVTAFKVEVSGIFQFFSLFTDCGPAYAGIKPDIENILFLYECIVAAMGASAPSGEEYAASFSNQISAPISHGIDDLLKCFPAPVWFPAFFTVEYRDRYAPGPLTSICTSPDGLAACCRFCLVPMRVSILSVDFFEGLLPQSLCSREINHCSVARKITGFLQRQQWGRNVRSLPYGAGGPALSVS